MRLARFRVALLALSAVGALFGVGRVLAQPLVRQPVPALPAPVATGSSDDAILKNAHLPTDGVGLVEFFRKRALSVVERETLLGLIARLDDADVARRNQAAGELIAYGATAVPLLREAANDLDMPERGQLARECLLNLEGSTGASVTIAATRQLAVVRPAGATVVLLEYLPYAPNDAVVEEVGKALEVVGFDRDGRPDSALLRAIRDETPLRRATAAEVLSKAAGEEERSAVRQLLQDPKPSVRLRVALALGIAHDADAIGVLIGLLDEVPSDASQKIEEFLTSLAGEWAIKAPPASDAVARRLRKELWTVWWKTADGPVLLEEFKRRSLPDAERLQVLATIEQLADDSAEKREQALSALQARGGVVLPLLETTANGSGKIAEAAKKAVAVLERDRLSPTPLVALRMVAIRKPAGALETLLEYVPFLSGDDLESEVRRALVAVAIHDGKIHPLLTKALEDPLPERRAMAAEVICQATFSPEQRAGVRTLLTDKDLVVRLRAAMAFAGVREKDAVPVLIDLLNELPLDRAYQAEEFLQFLAAEASPGALLGADAEARKKAHAAWTQWWRDNEAKVQLTRLDGPVRMLGYTLIVEQWNPQKGSGRVFEIDSAGRVRWEMAGLQYPIDAAMTGNQKLLVVEQSFQRVSERDLKGAVLWQKVMPQQPLSAQRLRNGNTFIAARGQLLELDKDGKEIWAHNQPNQDIIAAQKLRDGSIMYMTYNWQVTRLDAAGREQKTFRLGPFRFGIGQNAVDFLPNDRVLVASPNEHKVMEYDSNGKVVWEATVQFANSAVRLPNGRTLVSSMTQNRVVEIDRAGKVVWEQKDNMRPFKVQKR